MPYVRERSRELTGFQDSKPFSPAIDIGCDFAMVYGTDDGMPERISR